MAHRFHEAEQTDYLREAWDQERLIGTYEGVGDEEFNLNRARIAQDGMADGRLRRWSSMATAIRTGN
ncbi:MAG: hypothetical protein ACSLE1_21420 [Sphingobium sp.]